MYPEIHIFYICYGKLYFTRQTFPKILETNYSNLNLHIFNNGSLDNDETSEYFQNFLSNYNKKELKINYIKLDTAIPLLELRFQFLKTFQLLYSDFNIVAEIHNNLEIKDPNWIQKYLKKLNSKNDLFLIQSAINQNHLLQANGILYKSKHKKFKEILFSGGINFLKKLKILDWEQMLKIKFLNEFEILDDSGIKKLDNIETIKYHEKIKEEKQKGKKQITIEKAKIIERKKRQQLSPIKSNKIKRAKIKALKNKEPIKHFYPTTNIESVKIVQKVKKKNEIKIKKQKPIQKIPKNITSKNIEVIKIQPKLWRKK